MTLEVITVHGDKIVYTESKEYSFGDLQRLYKEYNELAGYKARFK